MDELLATITQAVRDLPPATDPAARVRALECIIEIVRGPLLITLGDARRAAVADLARTLGAAAAAEQLGISRARVYAIINRASS
jgi:hypothetical protein